MNNGDLVQLGDSIFVQYRDAYDVFRYWTGRNWTMDDQRYRSTRRYEGINPSLLCSVNEIYELYARIESYDLCDTPEESYEDKDDVVDDCDSYDESYEEWWT